MAVIIFLCPSLVTRRVRNHVHSTITTCRSSPRVFGTMGLTCSSIEVFIDFDSAIQIKGARNYFILFSVSYIHPTKKYFTRRVFS